MLFKYPKVIQLNTKFGMNSLQLAILLDREVRKNINQECLQSLFNSGHVDLKELEKKSDSSFVDFDFLQGSKNTLEMFIREATLCDSLKNNSPSTIRSFNWNSQDVQEEDYLDLHELLEGFTKSENHDFGEKCSLRRPKHKYFKTQKPKNSPTFPSPGKEVLDKEWYSPHQEGIKLIQKNVRGWLLRRQYLDIKYATRILQNYIRSRLKQKTSEDYRSLIKSKVKDWLYK